MIVIESMNHFGITVSNLEKAIKFYKDLFDFEIVDQITNVGKAILQITDIRISLYEVEGYQNSDEARNIISFHVDEEDFEDALDELEKMEVQIISGPENIKNGKTVTFVDPDNNKIELSYPKFSG